MPYTKNPIAQRPLALKQAVAAVLLVGAVACWGVILARQRATASVQGHIQAGIAAAQQARARQAEAEWVKALELDPKNKEAPQLLAGLYVSTQEWPKAVYAFQYLAKVSPETPHLHGNLATCLYQYGDQMGAYREAQEELKQDPDHVPALMIVARMSAALSDAQTEDKALLRLTTLMPDNPSLLKLYGEHLTYGGRSKEAEPILERFIRVSPKDPQAFALRGINRFNSDTSAAGAAKAETDFREAIRLSPTTPLAHLYLGKLYRRLGRKADAVKELETAYRLAPDTIAVTFELSQVYERAGESAKAADLRQKLMALRQEDDLKNTLQKRCVGDRDNFDNHLRLGLILLKNGQIHDATYYLNRAAFLRPNDPQARAALEKLADAARRAPPEQDVAARLLNEQVAAPENR